MAKVGWHIVLVAALLALVRVGNADAQGCCSPGSPATGALEKGGVLGGQIRISPSVYFIYLGESVSGSREVPDELGRKVEAWNYTIDLEYGVTSRLTLLTSFNYARRSRELTGIASDGSE